MSKETKTRISAFVRRTIDLHLPLMLGMIAERGGDEATQINRATRLIEVLNSVQLAETLMYAGRPIPVELRAQGRELVINQGMLARVDDEGLAGAMARPLARVMELPGSMVGLVLNLSDEQQIRGMISQMARNRPVVALTRIESLMRWRLERLEERLSRLMEVRREKPTEEEVGWREGFVRRLQGEQGAWPRFATVYEEPYLKAWMERVVRSLGSTVRGEGAQMVVEMVWESLVISPHSALRQAAQMLRSLNVEDASGAVLHLLARALGEEGRSVETSLESWPGLSEVWESWAALNGQEDALIGGWAGEAPAVSVLEGPQKSMGMTEPVTLPWGWPLLCWSMREREALADLLRGMTQTLERTMAVHRSGRLRSEAFGEQERQSWTVGEGIAQSRWMVQVPSRMPELKEGFERDQVRAFRSTTKGYFDVFQEVMMGDQVLIMNRLKGTYTGFLRQSKEVWRRRLRADPDAMPEEVFAMYLLGLARATGWAVFVDGFEGGAMSSRMAPMPGFTLLATWTTGAEFAPVWLPVEAIGEAWGQAPVRIRNVAVDKDGSTRWLGDHPFEMSEFRTLSMEGVLRGIHDGALLMTVHRNG